MSITEGPKGRIRNGKTGKRDEVEIVSVQGCENGILREA